MSRISLQSPLLQAALRRPTAQLIARCAPSTTTKSGATRTFSRLPTLRPTLTPTPTIFRPANPTTTTTTTIMFSSSDTTTGETTLDLLAKTSITAHPALSGCASQIRCGPRPTMAGSTRLVQKRRHGFLGRLRTKGGQNMLKRRRAKGRKRLGH